MSRKLGNFDVTPFKEAAEKMRMLEQDFQAFLERFAVEVGQIAIQRLQSHTPVLTGLLHASWRVESVTPTANGVEVGIVNDAGATGPGDDAGGYASFVNDGHEVRGEGRGWIPGKHMVELTERDLETLLPRAMKQQLAKYAKQLGFEVT